MNLRRSIAIIASGILLCAYGSSATAATVTRTTHSPAANASMIEDRAGRPDRAQLSAKTAACRKAIKAVKRAWKARVAAQKSGDITRFITAEMRWRQARDARTRICRLPTSAFTPPPVPEPTFSGNPKDPRPAGWVRPPDGSGLPGSNASQVTFTMANCPVTVSSFTIQPTLSATGWYFAAQLQNYTDQKRQIYWRATLIDADGTRWDSWVWDSQVLKAYGDGEYDLADLTFTIYPDDPFSPATSRVESFTVLDCRTV